MKLQFRRPFTLRDSLCMLIVVAFGVGLGVFAVAPLSLGGSAILQKIEGRANDCPWNRTLSYGRDQERFSILQMTIRSQLSILGEDRQLGIEHISTGTRRFWIKKAGETSGAELLAYLLADHEWMAEANPHEVVRPGDVVLDCGAHIGVFTAKALSLGAKVVVAIEPDRVNRECLLRNFIGEVASGRVVIVPQGVWSIRGTLTLNLSPKNSGGNSLVYRDEGAGSEVVPVTTIDYLVRDLRLPKVDFIKMDIEGAEREALRGGMATLKKYQPRLMLDSYHLPDDMSVLPQIIRQANHTYAMHCGPCEEQRGKLSPHVTFFDRN